MLESHTPRSARRSRHLIAAVAVLATCYGADRTLASDPVRLTMADVVAHALKSNYQLLAVDKQVAAAQTYLERSRSWLASNPTVTGGGSASDSKFETTLPNNQQGPSERFGPSYTFTAEQSFEVAGQRGLRIESATRGLAATQHDRLNTAANVGAEAKKAFAAALAARARAELAERSAKLIQQVNAAFDIASNDTDKERIAFNSSSMQMRRQQRRAASAARERDEAYRQVKRLAGISPELDIQLDGELERRPRPLPPLSELRAGLADRRHDVAAYRSLLDRANADLALARRSAVPDVSVFGFVTRFDGGDDTETSGGGSLGVTLPIFQDNGPNIPDAISERQRAAAELDDLVRLVDANLVTAYSHALDAADDLTLVIDEILPRAEDNVELQRRRVRRGEVRSLDIIDYDLELVNAEEELVAARRAYTQALIELEKAAGVELLVAGPVSAPEPQAASADEHQPAAE
jgi:cobalt-zinc-cadmium efflux system outer membrane protein